MVQPTSRENVTNAYELTVRVPSLHSPRLTTDSNATRAVREGRLAFSSFAHAGKPTAKHAGVLQLPARGGLR